MGTLYHLKIGLDLYSLMFRPGLHAEDFISCCLKQRKEKCDMRRTKFNVYVDGRKWYVMRQF